MQSVGLTNNDPFEATINYGIKMTLGQKDESDKAAAKGAGISLKQLAAHLELSPTTLSLVLNDAPSATSIPQETKDRIFSAAKELNYRPNYLARSLRVQRTHTLGVIVPELSDGYSAMVLNGVEAALVDQGLFLFDREPPAPRRPARETDRMFWSNGRSRASSPSIRRSGSHRICRSSMFQGTRTSKASRT